jgi:hypothetical protein
MNEFNPSGLVFFALASQASSSRASALMRFLFQGCDDLVKTPDIGGANSMNNGAFQCG